MTAAVHIVSVAMIVFGALLVYDGLLLAHRTGFGRANLSIMAAGAVDMALFWAVWDMADRASWRFGAFGIDWAGFVAGAFLMGFLVYIGATVVLVKHRPTDDYRYVLVLGAGLVEGLRPSRLLAGRCDVGKLWLQAPACDEVVARERRLVLCGGQGSDECVSEACAMRAYLLDRGVDDGRMILEDRSTTTEENLAFAQRIMGDRASGRGAENENPGSSGRSGLCRCLIVTNNFHALRTSLMAQKAHMDCAGVIGKPTRLYYLPAAAARDYLGVLRLYPAAVVAVMAVCAVASGLYSFGML